LFHLLAVLRDHDSFDSAALKWNIDVQES